MRCAAGAVQRALLLQRRASLAVATAPPAAQRGARRRAHAPLVVRAARGGWQSELEELAAERAGGAAPPPKAAPKGFGSALAAPRRAPLAVVRYPDPRLRAPNADITVFDAALKQLSMDMFTLMYKCALGGTCGIRRQLPAVP
jgi:hypothetical protein